MDSTHSWPNKLKHAVCTYMYISAFVLAGGLVKPLRCQCFFFEFIEKTATRTPLDRLSVNHGVNNEQSVTLSRDLADLGFEN